ncbi:hypothetical protein [Mesorhizobium sp. NZP2234]|uniref:hypothetical protein n=1 Tax=Mesorhizobium sp. NZP2234 TaxID=2483402 RepID=UPI001551AB1D|nr:hypothetical protein [Mesorhizobium sp. NZP2234]
MDTTDRLKARTSRDLHEAADNAMVVSYVGRNPKAAHIRYQRAIKRAEALGFVCRPLTDILVAEPLDTILQRAEATIGEPASSPVVDAVTGIVSRPDDKISEALKLYFDEIVRDGLRTKSSDQKKRWKAKRQMSVDVFITFSATSQWERSHATTRVRCINIGWTELHPRRGGQTVRRRLETEIWGTCEPFMATTIVISVHPNRRIRSPISHAATSLNAVVHRSRLTGF